MKLIRQGAAVILVLAAAWLLSSTAVGAHTGFESSDPADGESTAGPVETITLVFTGDAEPTGRGFEVLDPGGSIREPIEASTVDGRIWILRFEPALEGGVVGVRWSVKAPDAHPIDGSFSFTTPPAEVSTDAADSATAATSVPAAPSVPPTDEADPGETPAETAVTEVPSMSADPADIVSQTSEDLEEFLGENSSPSGTADTLGAAGRLITLVGSLVGVGGLVFAVTTMRGRQRDVRHVMFWVRRAGLLAVVGAIVEVVAQIVIESAGAWSGIWSPSAIGGVVGSSFGIATGLRIFGGVMLAVGARLDTIAAVDIVDPVVALRWSSLQDAGPGDPMVRDGDQAWRYGPESSLAVVGAIALLGAHLFDGHTVTKGNRFLTGVLDIVHVAGGAVWAGGVLMLVAVLWLRHRDGRDLRARQLALRFSVVATVALVIVGLAGVALTVIVLDSPSELWATEWGRTLMVKTGFVGLAAATGAYNHKILIPLLNAAPDDRALARRFRNIVSVEAVALIVVVIATAYLMGAAS